MRSGCLGDVTRFLKRHDKTLNEASILEALNGPEDAAVWMWQEAKTRAFPMAVKALLMTVHPG